jgi:hypothetical protein
MMGASMGARLWLVAAFAVAPWAPPARPGELARPLTAREWVALRAMSRFATYAEVCKPQMPGMDGAWDRALAGISTTIDRVIDQQLATQRFAGLGKVSVPAASYGNLLRGVDKARGELKKRLESQDPYDNCPKFLRNAQGFGDSDLGPIVIDALAGFRTLLKATR